MNKKITTLSNNIQDKLMQWQKTQIWASKKEQIGLGIVAAVIISGLAYSAWDVNRPVAVPEPEVAVRTDKEAKTETPAAEQTPETGASGSIAVAVVTASTKATTTNTTTIKHSDPVLQTVCEGVCVEIEVDASADPALPQAPDAPKLPANELL